MIKAIDVIMGIVCFGVFGYGAWTLYTIYVLGT